MPSIFSGVSVKFNSLGEERIFYSFVIPGLTRNPGVCNQTEIWIPSVLDPGLSEDEIDTRILHQLKIYVELVLFKVLIHVLKS